MSDVYRYMNMCISPCSFFCLFWALLHGLAIIIIMIIMQAYITLWQYKEWQKNDKKWKNNEMNWNKKYINFNLFVATCPIGIVTVKFNALKWSEMIFSMKMNVNATFSSERLENSSIRHLLFYGYLLILMKNSNTHHYSFHWSKFKHSYFITYIAINFARPSDRFRFTERKIELNKNKIWNECLLCTL